MREIIIKFGQVKTILLITLISIVISNIIYTPVGFYFMADNYKIGFVISTFIPMIIAPSISWYFIKLFIHIHHLEQDMRELATFDDLTKVMARKAFLINTNQIFELQKRTKEELSILYIDIDDFKKVNDTYGHNFGDDVLRNFGFILNKNKRTSDLIGRLGGEEFAFTLPNTNLAGAKHFAEIIRNIVKDNKIKHNSENISYTISIGISTLSANRDISLDELINQADKALYDAKHTGKDKTVIYSE